MGLALLPGEATCLCVLAALAAKEQRWDEALALAALAQPHTNEKWTKWLDAIIVGAPQ